MGAPWYVTRERVKSALDVAETARRNDQIDDAIEAGARSVERLCQRVFYPTQATRYKDWPTPAMSTPWRVWLDADEIISLDSLTSAGTTIDATNYYLEPVNAGPPYTHVEINLGTSAAFGQTTTAQRAIAMTGLFGYADDSVSAGTLAASMSSTTTTTADMTLGNAVGVGSVLKCGTERMIVTDRTMLTTAQTLQTSLTASAANVAVAVTTGTGYAVGETILIESERMLIVDIAGNTLTVRRATDGSVLAAHTSGVTIYAPRRLTVTRGALGTTAATHSSSAAVTAYKPPALVTQLNLGEALMALGSALAGYSATRDSRSGTKQTITPLEDLRSRVFDAHGRKARIRVVA